MLKPTPVNRLCLGAARSIAALVLAVGLCGLLGWILDHPLLKGVFPGGVTIKVNAAIGLILGGTALGLLSPSAGPIRRRTGRICASAAAALGGVTFLQHLTGFDFGIDQFWFKEPPGALATTSPGRMGPPASMSLFLGGIALLLLDAKSRASRILFQAFAIMIVAITSVPLIGYAHDVDELYVTSKYTGIALHTAIALWMLGAGILLLRPQIGLMAVIGAPDAGGLMARRLMLPVIALPFATGWLRWMGERSGTVEGALGRPLAILFLSFCGGWLILFNARRMSALDRQRGRTLKTEQFLNGLHQHLVPLDQPEAILRAAGEHLGRFLDVDRCQFCNWNTGTGTAQLVGGWCREDVVSLPAEFLFHDYAPRLWRERWIDGITIGEVEADPELRPYLAKYRALDIRALAAAADVQPDKSALLLVVAARRPRHPSGEEPAFLKTVTERVWPLLERARTEQALLQASRAKDAFIATISHELRTPLSPVLLIAGQAAENPTLPPDVRRDFSIIRHHVELEARLIDDLLDLSRITHGKLALQLERINATDLLRDAVDIIRKDAEAKRITLREESPATPVWLRADPVRLQQVFWNVLKNAVKFTSEGGSITVHAELSADEQQFLATVEDDGFGMTAAELARVFEAFSQGEHATNPSAHPFGGLGIGLAISKRLIAMHDGSISAESAGRDQGTRVRITLPVAHAVPLSDVPAPSKVLSAPSRGSRVSTGAATGARVLVVEDHASTREALVTLLRRRNFRVITAASKAQALEVATSGEIDLLISDVGLPDGDGCELMKTLRQTRSLRGIAMTGYGMEADLARTRAAGFIAHLTKPVRVQALDAALSAAFRDGTAPPASSSAPENENVGRVV